MFFPHTRWIILLYFILFWGYLFSLLHHMFAAVSLFQFLTRLFHPLCSCQVMNRNKSLLLQSAQKFKEICNILYSGEWSWWHSDKSLKKIAFNFSSAFLPKAVQFFLKGLQPSSESLCCFFVHRETNYFTKLFTIWRSELTAPWRCDIFIEPLHKQVIVLDNKKTCQPSSGQRAEARFDFEEYVGILRGIWSILLSDNSLIIERHG